MTKIDKSYLEKLGEVLYDEKKPINYKTVSVMLGVHVNIAKQMLFHLRKEGNGKGKKLYPTYYISGMMPRKVIMSLQKKSSDGDSDTSKQLSGGDLDAYLVTLCREKGLEDLKAKFTKIFSIHMYSLSAFPIENYDVLDNLVEFPLRDSEGRTPVDLCPIICSASQKLLNGDTRPAPVLNDASKTKSEVVKNEVKKSDANKESAGKDFFKSSKTNGSKNEDTPKKNGMIESNSEKVVKPVPAPTEKKDRLKSMFAAAATKPKTQKAEKPAAVVKPDTKNEQKSKTPENNSKETSSGRSKNSRKRKRIRDVLSSDSEGDEKNSEDDEDSQPGSPVQRKRIQIDSDSEDEVKETRTKTPEPEEPKEVSVVPGRRRVAKMISKSYLDKDGFLVTTKEQVMVSEDEDDAKCKVKEEPRKSILEAKTINGLSKSSPEKPSGKSNASKNASGKTKQASLMSFFQKK